jgi:hypothetical protein
MELSLATGEVQCSRRHSASRRNKWNHPFSYPPTGLGPVPVAAVLRFDIDTAGSVSGTEARNVGGGFANETFKGMVFVNPNRAGTTTVMFFESGVLVRTSALALVFDDLSTQVRLV